MMKKKVTFLQKRSQITDETVNQFMDPSVPKKFNLRPPKVQDPTVEGLKIN